VTARLLLGLLLAQAPAADATEAARLERIRKALTETQAIAVSPPAPGAGPVFRVTVRARKPERAQWEGLWETTPSYVRTWFPGYHHEFLERVTREEFRSATLYPVGEVNTAMIELLVKGIKLASRKMSEAAARREVQRALDELRACRANPDRPGC
jgi:hypothetical protein